MECWYCITGKLPQGGSWPFSYWGCFPVSLVYECQHDQGHGIQCILLLQLVSLADLLWEDRNAWRPGIRDLLFALGTVGMILFRNNGKYAMIVLLAFTFLTFCFGKKRGSSGGDCWWYAEQLSA